MTGGRASTVLVSAVLAVAFGVVDGVLWSGENSTAFWLDNISSCYLLLAFLAGWAITARQAPVWTGPICGLMVTVSALAGFYGWQMHHLSLSTSGVQTGLLRYGAGGVVSGPVFGFLGALWARRRAWYAIATVGVAFLVEPLAWKVHDGFQLMPADVQSVEFTVGSLILILGAISIRCRTATVP